MVGWLLGRCKRLGLGSGGYHVMCRLVYAICVDLHLGAPTGVDSECREGLRRARSASFLVAEWCWIHVALRC